LSIVSSETDKISKALRDYEHDPLWQKSRF